MDDDKTSIEVENFVANLCNGQALLTSRLSNWDNRSYTPIQLIQIDRASSIEIILEGTKQKRIRADSEYEDANELARVLGDIPLALQQAVGFISRKRASISNYFSWWKSIDSRVLEWHDEALLKYPRSFASTWELSFEEMKPEGRKALRLICWLAPAPIPKALLETVTKVSDPFDIEEGIAELEKYSFLRYVDQELVQVHGAVSDITRYRMSDSEKAAELTKSVEAVSIFIRNYHPFDPETWPTLYSPCLEHFSYLTQYCHAAKQSLLGAEIIEHLGLFLFGVAEYEPAERLYRRLLRIQKASLGPDHPDVATSLNNLARVLSNTNRKAEAELLHRQALSIEEASLEPDHPRVAMSLSNLAVLLYRTNRKEEAEPLAKRALMILIAHDKSSAEPNFIYEPAKELYSIILKSLGYTPERIATTLSEIEAEAISKLTSNQKPKAE